MPKKVLIDAIYQILRDEIGTEQDPCLCDDDCFMGHQVTGGYSEAGDAIEALLKKNGIDPYQEVK